MIDLWRDPAFLELPPEEKHKVLIRVDPDYRGLPEADQRQVAGFKMPPAPQSQQQPQPQITDPIADSLGLFSPAAAGAGARMIAPEAGAIAGGLIGSRIPIPGAAPFLTGLGYGGGEAIKAGAIPTVEQFAQDFGRGAASEMAVKPFTWLASKAFQPVKQAFTMLYAGKLAQRGLPIPASLLNPSEKGLMLAEKARKSYPGNQVVQKAHEELRTGAQDMIREFETRWGVNEFTKEAADKAFADWAKAMGGNNAPAPLPNALAVIDDVIKKPFVTSAGEKDASRWWLKEALTFRNNPTVQGLRDIWATISGGQGADKTARQKLLNAIKTDIREQYGEKVLNMLDAARNQNTWWKKIAALQEVIKRSYATVDGVDTFMPDRFAREWFQTRNRTKIRTKFSADEIAEIDEFANLMGVIGSELGRKVSQKSFGLAEALPLAGIAGGALAKPKAIPLAALGVIQPMLSRRAGQIYRPGSGLYKRMLGEPGARSMLPNVVNIGGKLVIIKGTEDNDNE